MRHSVSITLATLLLSSAAFAAKPPPPPPQSPPDIQVAYRLPDGKGTKLVLSNENGANQMTLYKASTTFRFDIAPRAQQQIAIVDNSMRTLRLLNYSVNTSGVYTAGSIANLGPAGSSGSVDFSPDGTKIAYACCGTDNDQLIVHDLVTGEKTVWAQGIYYFDIAWFRGGSSIVYTTVIPLEIREVTAPMAAPQLLYTESQGQLDVDSARTNPNRLVINHNDHNGNTRVGLWEAGVGFIDENLANRTQAWWGTLNCDDTKLGYSGSGAFYVLDLNTGIDTLVSKKANIMLQFWPTCS
jgi:hypothetical protein